MAVAFVTLSAMGAVVHLDEAFAPSPRLTEVYFVQTYTQGRDRLIPAKFEQFASMESALRAGQKAAVKAAGVKVCRVRGNASADYWERPVKIAKWGEIPPT